ncbi:unnamed protein product [Caenorhabditis auriculariae]|uniref:Uncharacterized protein n=1 Tax=Caenorhabditis auriculariae TaxID=2777116 RepID=A0A8S1H052_9PELO|nr:unnamed protein product [Caenorhabditis auriculariae]
MRQLLAILFLAAALFVGGADARRRRLGLPRRDVIDGVNYPAKVMFYKGMKLDHFTYSDTRTFDLRWMWNNTFYKPGGPIFFYSGNEGDLTGFVTATGIMFDIAQMFNAAIIFAEHRFYGVTQPFGNESYSSIPHMGLLTSEQALADYAQLLTVLKTKNNQFNYTYSADTKVITFGGSYGGMLSAWFRQKYPHIVDGAWAGSAPLIYFRDGGVDPGAFDNITSRTYVDAGCNRYILANCWNAVIRLSSTASGRNWLNTQFKFDPRTPIRNTTDGWNFNYYLREAIEYMAMVDYPYPTGFLEPLPGWPVKAACANMNATGTNFTDQQLVTMVVSAANIYYNYNNNASYVYCIDDSICGDSGVSGLGNDQLGWPWQECSEIIIAMCSKGGDNDVFWNECGADLFQTLAAGCSSVFGSFNWTSATWNIDAVKTLYGLNLAGASNIILTQGHLDPWSGGGFKKDKTDVSRGLYVLEIPGSAHHLDLRTPNTCDPNTITNARFQIIGILRCWLDPSCTTNPSLTDLPAMTIPNAACKDVNNGYPWGQTTASAPAAFLLISFIATLLHLF